MADGLTRNLGVDAEACQAVAMEHPKDLVDVHLSAKVIGVQLMMGKLMRRGEPLSVRVMQGVHPDNAHAVADERHSG